MNTIDAAEAELARISGSEGETDTPDSADDAQTRKERRKELRKEQRRALRRAEAQEGTPADTDPEPEPEADAAEKPDPKPQPEEPDPKPETAQPAEPEAEADDDAEDDDDDGPQNNRRRNKRGKNKGKEPKVIFIPPPTVGGARPRRRHWGVLLSFLLVVVAPFSVAGWYLTERAVDQFASTLGFSVRREDAGSNFDGLSTGLFDLGQQSSSDTDVLYEFIQSQEMVERVNTRLDLRAMYSAPQNDPVFALGADASIEDLVQYWQRMVTIFYDAGTGLMEVRALAFDPNDAQNVNIAIFEESSAMINSLTAISRDDSTRYAREDLERAVEQLRDARVAITNFRTENQFVNPDERLNIDVSLIGALNSQLADAEIELALLQENARDGDPRLRQAEQRITVIKAKIAEEQAKFGSSATGQKAYATLVGEYESLIVDREFAESAYLAALANYNEAQAEATRQSRYLAPHIEPTLAQTAEYPRRSMLLSVLGLILAMGWAIVAMLYYSIKDRR